MSKFKVLVLFLFIVSLVQAQKEANNWYFGNNAGVTFASGSPVAVTNGKMNNWEGVASISNKHGNLLFYTDGEKVYTRTHAVMDPTTHVLKGHNSSTQSAVIVPQPITGRYFVFTVDEEWKANGFQYSVVDTSINAGQGRILTMNQVLLTKAAEKVSAVLHANKVDYWVIAHGANDNKWYAYKLTAAGISNTPVVSTVGPVHSTSDVGYSKGYLKFSADGTKLASANNGNNTNGGGGRVELYDFDAKTGIVSNSLVFDGSNAPSGLHATDKSKSYDGSYGVEFSPNGRFLYSCGWVRGNKVLIQIDLFAGTPSQILASPLKIADASGTDFGALQVGPNGKIYIARNNVTYLSSIEKPNCLGSACNYVSNSVSLSGKRSVLGLPTFIQSYFNKSEFEFGQTPQGARQSNLCFGENTKFQIRDSTGIDSARWTFGDIASGNLNTAKGFTAWHKFTDDTSFRVKVQIFRNVPNPNCLADTSVKVINIFKIPEVKLGPDTFICEGENIVFDGTATNATYNWSNGTKTPVNAFTAKGWYWLDIKIGGCVGRDSVYIDEVKYPNPKLGNDTLICLGDSLKLYGGTAQKFLWNNGKTDSAIFVKNSGQYILTLSNKICIKSDTININNSVPPSIYLGVDKTICNGDSVLLDASSVWAKSWLWSSGSTNSKIYAKNNATYWVKIKDTLCYGADTMILTLQNKGVFNIGPDTAICQGYTKYITANYPGATSYQWHDGSTNQTFGANTAGKKKVTVSNGICTISDSLNITVKSIPTMNLGNDTTICIGDSVVPLPNPYLNISYKWNANSAWNYSNLAIKSSGKYFVDVVDLPQKVCHWSDTIRVTVQPIPFLNLGNDTTLCPGTDMTLDVSQFTTNNYFWMDANNNKVRKNNPSIVKHWIRIQQGACKISDTININYKSPILINLGADKVLCEDQIANLDVAFSGATSYKWYQPSAPLSILGSTSKYDILYPGGLFTAEISDGTCKKSDTIDVQFKTYPTPYIGKDTVMCDNSTLLLQVDPTNSETITWIDNSTLPTFNVSKSGMYWVETANGLCAKRDSINVTYAQSPVILFPFGDTIVCDIPRLTFDFSQPNVLFRWNDGNTNPIRTITVPGTYWIVGENNCGYDSAGITISVDEFGCQLLTPSAFSPNADNINDVWKPQGKVLAWGDLIVYDRWGKILHKDTADKGWNGMVDNTPVPIGAYVYVYTYRQSIGGYPRWFSKKGIIHIIK